MPRMFAYEREWLRRSNNIADALNKVQGKAANFLTIEQWRREMRQIEDRNKGFFRDLDTRYVPASERPFK